MNAERAWHGQDLEGARARAREISGVVVKSQPPESDPVKQDGYWSDCPGHFVTLSPALPAGTVIVEREGRQGDIIFNRMGDATPKPAEATPDTTLAAGAHGLHVLRACRMHISAPFGEFDDFDLTLPDGGLIEHTDVPAARHDALWLEPGCWRVMRQQEVSADGSVRAVVD